MGSAAYREANRERLRREAREYRLQNLDRIKAYREENREAIRAYQREYNRRYREKHADKLKADKRRYYEENTERVKQKVAEWQRQNREHFREWARRNARLRLAGRDADTFFYGEVIRIDPCSYCDGRADTVDHIEPISAGGANNWQNLTGACRSCNSKKQVRPLLVYLLERAT